MDVLVIGMAEVGIEGCIGDVFDDEAKVYFTFGGR